MSSEEPRSAGSPPSMQLMWLLWPGAMTVQAIHVAAKLGVADLVAAGPKTVLELAEATRTHGPSLGRLLRAPTSLWIFVEDPEGRYRQTALSDLLRTDHPQSMRPFAMMLGAGFFWRPSGELDVTIRTGQPAFEHVYGAQFFKHLAEHPDDAAVFNAAMSSLPVYITAIVDAYDFSKFERIVDIGGGHGALLFAILTSNPRVHGVLYDLPGVVTGASVPSTVADRLEIVAGDFFEAVPAGADAYLLKGIIHDWNDASAAAILNNCRRAIRPDGRLFIVDTVLISSSDPASALMDMLMMVLTRGRERTESEFRFLLREAGFSLVNVIPTARHSILECRPV
jgi:SAM-dependent methyltransferase